MCGTPRSGNRATTIGTLAAGACARIRIKANAWLTGLV
jgi:hypothetical protein